MPEKEIGQLTTQVIIIPALALPSTLLVAVLFSSFLFYLLKLLVLMLFLLSLLLLVVSEVDRSIMKEDRDSNWPSWE